MNTFNDEICSLFAEILGIDTVSDRDALFIELGGQSVMMGVLQNKLKTKYGVSVPFEEMFENGSVNGISAYISAHKNNVIYDYGKVDFAPEPEKRFEKFPLTDMQRAYYVGRMEETELGGNPTRGYSEVICTDYDRNRMEEAVNKLFKAHDILRLRFNDDLTQQVEPEFGHYELVEDDISALSEEEQKKFIAKKRERIFNTIFDIKKLPLVSFEATKTAPDKALIHFSHDGLIIDGWSHEKIIHDLDAVYADPTLEVPVSKIRFRDYARYLELVRETQKYKEDMAYWLSRRLDKYKKPALPLKCEPEAVKEVNTRQVIRYIDSNIWNSVKKYASQKNITPFSLMITAYAKSLLKYSSNNNFLMSVPASIRPDISEDIDALVGECSNFFVCGFNNDKDVSILDSAYANQKQIAEIMQHNSFMGTDYIREMQKRSGAEIICPTVFTSIIDTPLRDYKNLTKIYTKTHTSQIWIDAIAMKNSDGIMLIMDCTAQMFDEEITDGIADTFVSILEMYASFDKYVEETGCAPILEREKQTITDCIAGDMGTNTNNLSDLLYSAYISNRERPAVICNDQITTYEEFYQEAYCIAAEIRSVTGLDSKFAIGLFMDKSKYQPIASIAATLINCPFMPLDIQYGIDHISYCVKNADVKVIVTDNMFYDKLAGKVSCKLINIEKIRFTYDNEISFVKADPTDSAFIINTSGTTGKPKSVDLKYDGLVNCIEETRLRFKLDNNDRMFSITNYCHDMSVYDIYGAFTVGGAMVIPDYDKQKDPQHWLYLIEKYKVTFWNSVPSFHEMLVAADIENTADYLDSVKHILSGGESLKIPLAKKMREIFRNAELNNVGGPSEATIWSIWHKITPEDLENNLIPYGKPLKNMRYYILSDMMSICPPGVEGTMFVAGVGVAKGYLGLKEATEKNFVTFDGVRVYNTGDRGLYLPNGSIKFLGRKDTQVKINGKRIELEGIARNINEFEGILSCEVILCEKSHALVAFYTGDSSIDKKKILHGLREKLPDYMVPSDMIYIDSIPLTKNGKTDIKALNNIYNEKTVDARFAVNEEATQLEKEVAQICGNILGRENVMPEDNFYELGGNSISAIKLISAIKDKYEVSVTIYDILNHFCVRKWCSIIEEKMALDRVDADEKIEIRDIPKQMPLSKNQEGMWFQSKSADMASSTNLFVLSGSMSMKTADFDPELFHIAVNKMISENAVLRTRVKEGINTPYQVFEEPFPYTPEYKEYDIPHSEAEKIMEEDAMINKISVSGFPLFCIEVGKCSDGYTAVTIGIHHIISDTATIDIMFEELDRNYSKAKKGITGSESNQVKYSDFLLWQDEMLDKGKYDEDIAFWKTKLVDVPVLDFAENNGKWEDQTTEVKEIALSPEEMRRFSNICKHHNYTAFRGISAIMNMTAKFFFNTDRIVMGMADAARSRQEIEKTMGCFAVSTIIDTVLRDSDSFYDVLDKTNKSINDSIKHTSLPFGTVVEKTGVDKRYSMLPYNIMINGYKTVELNLDHFSERRFARINAPVTVSLMIDFSTDTPSMLLGYIKSKISEEMAEDIVSVMEDITRAVIADPESTVGKIESDLMK